MKEKHLFTEKDIEKTKYRVICLEYFVKFIDKLDERYALIAKMLYFGGSRTLNEVVKLNLSSINFKRHTVNFRHQIVSYSNHIFLDIKQLVNSRKKGPVFLGRNSTTINRVTIFRNFKEAACKVGLGASFTPKMLTEDK
jgi:integrase